MTMDNHELRMAAGQAAITSVDALSDKTLAAYEPFVEATANLIEQLDSTGVNPQAVHQMVIGGVVGVLFSWDQHRREGEGRNQ